MREGGRQFSPEQAIASPSHRCYAAAMSYPRHPRTDLDVIIFGFIIVVVGFAVIMIGAPLGLWPLPF